MFSSFSQKNAPILPLWHRCRACTAICILALVILARADNTPLTAPALADAGPIARGIDGGVIKLMANKSQVLNTTRPYKRISTAQPDIADITAVAPTSLLLTAKKAGRTQLILWDDNDRSQMIDVVVEFDLQSLQQELKTIFPAAKIEVGNTNGAIILRGRVPNLQVAEQAVQVATPYGNKVLNFLEVAGGQQVMLQVRFAEVSRSASSALGVNFGYTDGRSFSASNLGQISPLGINQSQTNTTVDLAIQSPSPAVTLFGQAAIGQSALGYFITALRQNNLLRILAEPNLVTASGQEASFLAGGEFPVPIAQSGAGTGSSPAITIQYREFGVKLLFVPIVLGDGRIRIKVAPEVSDLDFTTAVKFSGFVVPGLTSRKVQTTVELADGQTFAIAGLINNNVTASKDVTPLLGDLPVLGALFRSVRYQRKETELVVLVTPRLVEAMNPNQLPPLPGEKWTHPSENDLFLNATLGGPATAAAKSAAEPPAASGQHPRFYGQYGFHPAAATHQ